MELNCFVPVLLFFVLHIQSSMPEFYLSSSVLQNVSCLPECSSAVLRRSQAKKVVVVCGSNAVSCPINMIHNIPRISWTLFLRSRKNVTVDRRDICLLASDTIADSLALFNESKMCHKSNILITFPFSTSDELPELKTLFDFAWKHGIVDIVVVLADSLCRVYTYVPFTKGGICYDTSPVFLNSWYRDQTSTSNDSVAYFPNNKIWSLHGCRLDLTYPKVREGVYKSFRSIIFFLEAAMNSSVKSSPTTNFYSEIDSNDGNSSKIMVALRSVNPTMHHSVVVPSYFHRYETVYAVPRVLPVTSIHWFRIFNELSKNVWYGLLVSLVASVAILYAFAKGQKDLVKITMFALKPLLGMAWSGIFSSWQARIYLAFWFFFCLVLNSSYLCSLLSDLTRQFNEDAIKSLHDLLKSKLPIQTSISPNAFDSFYKTDPLYRILKEKLVFVTMSKYFAMLDAKRSDTAYVVSRSEFDTLFINMSYRLVERRFIDTAAVPITMTRPTPYERFFQISVLRAISAGALEYASLVHQRNVLKRLMYKIWEPTGPGPLSLISLGPVFVIWSAGCALASLGFIIEIFWQRITR